MNAFQTIRRTVSSSAVLFLLLLGTALARGAEEAASENFDSFRRVASPPWKPLWGP